jgi:hypothetical protein
MNLRLVRASEIFQRFDKLHVKHKPGKENVIPDALSRLASSNSSTYAESRSELDALHCASFDAEVPIYQHVAPSSKYARTSERRSQTATRKTLAGVESYSRSSIMKSLVTTLLAFDLNETIPPNKHRKSSQSITLIELLDTGASAYPLP